MMQPLRSWAQVQLGTEARPFLVRWSTSYAPRAATDGLGLNYESYALRTAADGTRVYFTGGVIMAGSRTTRRASPRST